MQNVSFKNTQLAFRHKSIGQLRRAKFLFSLLQYAWLGNILSSLGAWALSVGLPIKGIIKATIYRQFVGGETKQEYLPVITHLMRHKVYTILDYSVEGQEAESDFEQTKNTVLDILMQAKENKAIPFACIKISGLSSQTLLEKCATKEPLSTSEQTAYEALMKRLDAVFSTAHRIDVPVYVDAEESWIQPAIDALCESFIFTYNKQKAIVYTTIQMYRHDRLAYLKMLHANCIEKQVHLGVKVVRGAYLEKEAARAENYRVESPVFTTKTDCDAAYNTAVAYCLQHVASISICLGTHNEESCMHAIRLMHQNNIELNHKNIWFSQLYGMSDHISFNLAHHGYNVTKYLPFGPVKHTIPYLSRRAAENSAISGQMSKELRIITEELKRRKHE